MQDVLVTSVGAGTLSPVTYFRAADPAGPVVATCYAPVAVARLVLAERRPLRALVLVTAEADAKHGAPLEAELADAGLDVQRVPVPLGRDEAEVWEIFRQLRDALPERARVVLDITHALRHLPLVFLTTVGYLEALDGSVELAGATYGAFEAPDARKRRPLLDLSPLLELNRWSRAAAIFRRTGNARHLADLIGVRKDALFRAGDRDEALRGLSGALQGVHAALSAGLPLEAGLQAARAREAFGPSQWEALQPRFPALEALRRRVADTLDRFAVAEAPRTARDAKDKRAVRLDHDELARQLRVARWYLELGDVARALLVLREAMVNRTLLARGRADAWLDYAGARAPAERLLNAARDRAKTEAFAWPHPGQRELGKLWTALADRRNAYAHAGYKPERVDPEAGAADVGRLLTELEGLWDDDAIWRLEFSDGDGVLVTPLGQSRGVLFTALRRLRPRRVLVVTSREARAGVEEALAAAAAPGAEAFVAPEAVVVAEVDPFRAHADWEALWSAHGRFLVDAGTVHLNLTGGTTSMQVAVERLGQRAARVGAQVRRLCLLDPRPGPAQQRDPYVAGELVWLDDAPTAEEDAP